MVSPSCLVALCLLAPGQSAALTGAISGVVVNGSRANRPLPNAPVVLRVLAKGQMVVLTQTVTGDDGRFVFDEVPIAPGVAYVAGANLQEIHYPGPRVRLTAAQRFARVRIRAFETCAEPSPLVARRHAVQVGVERGLLRVRESLTIDNPSTRSYVGRAAPDKEPVTLRLSIPPDFEKVTFDQEFFGRNFRVADGKLITSIPWTPGKREVNFTYLAPVHTSWCVWSRTLDLPTDDLQIAIADGQEACCSLPSRTRDDGRVVFSSQGQPLPAGEAIELQLGRVPLQWMSYGRWAAPAILVCLAAAALWTTSRRAGGRRSPAARGAAASLPNDAPPPAGASDHARPTKGRKPPPSRRRRAA